MRRLSKYEVDEMMDVFEFFDLIDASIVYASPMYELEGDIINRNPLDEEGYKLCSILKNIKSEIETNPDLMSVIYRIRTASHMKDFSDINDFFNHVAEAKDLRDEIMPSIKSLFLIEGILLK